MAYGDGYGGSTSTTRPKSTSSGSSGGSSGGSYGGGYGSGGGSSGGGGSSSGGSSSSKSANLEKVSSNLRNAIGAGNVRKVRHITHKLSPRDRKALLAITQAMAPDNSFLGKVGSGLEDTLTNAPVGLFNTAKAGASEVYQPFRTLRDVAEGKKVGLDQGIGSLPGIGQAYGVGRGFVEQNPDATYNPLTSAIGASFRHTTNRLTDPKQLVSDYSKHPVQTALEDAGNVGIVGGVAAKGARLAGLEKTANVLETGSRTLNDVAGAPFLPVSPVARGLNRGALHLVEKADASNRLGPVLAHLHISAAARDAKSKLSEEVDAKGQAQNAIARDYVKPVEKIVGPSKHVQEALYAVAKGIDKTLAKVRAASPDTFDQFIHDHRDELSNMTVKAAHIAADYAEKVDPKIVAKFDEALPILEKTSGVRQAGALARDELNPEQLGHDPLTAPVAAATTPLETVAAGLREDATKIRARAEEAKARAGDIAATGADKVARQKEMTTIGEFGPPLTNVRRAEGDVGGPITGKDINAERAVARTGMSETRRSTAAETRANMLDTRARAAERRATRAESKVESVRANVENAVNTAPARLRPILEANRAAVSHLTEQENALRGQGLHEEAAAVGRAAGEVVTTLGALKDAGIDAPHYIRTVERDKPVAPTVRPGVTPVKPGSQRQRTGKGHGHDSVREQARAEVRRASEVIRNETVAKLESAPYARKAGEFVTDPNARAMQIMPTVKELDDAGYAPLAGPGAAITSDTVVVPKEVVELFNRYHKPSGGFERLIEHTYDPVTRAFKAVVLPLSPSWQVGNAIGNTFMAMAGGGLGPVALGKGILQSLAEWKKTGQFPGPERVRSHGATYEAQDILREGESARKLHLPGRAGQVASAVNPINVGYRFNEFVDNLGRSAVYLAQKKKGYSEAMATKMSLRAMGDFTKLSPFEKQVVRRIIPFYAWQKHLAKLAMTLPIEHPLRTAITLNFANQFSTKEDWESLLPGYAQGGIPINSGNSYIQTSSLFPFRDPISFITDTLQGNPQRQLSNINPILKAILENTTGVNTFTGRPFTRPPGTGKFNDSGQALPTAPSLLTQIKGLSPQARFLEQLSGRKDIARYETGDAVKVRDPKTGKKVTIPTPKDDLETVLSRFGVTIKSKKDLQSFVDAITKRRVQNWKDAHPKKSLAKKGSK